MLSSGLEVSMHRFFLVSALSLAGCGGSGGSSSSGGAVTSTIEVDHYRVPCVGEARFLCMRAKEKGEADFTLMYGSIKGFDPMWGHAYVLEIEETAVEDPPADGSSVEYSLKSVVSDTAVAPGTTFVVLVDGSSDDKGYNPDLTLDGSAGGTLLGSAAFTCSDATVCDAANQVEMGGKMADLTFGYPDPPGLPLVLQKVEPR